MSSKLSVLIILFCVSICVTLLICMNSLYAEDASVRLASFNIKLFSKKSRTDTDLEVIASIIKQYDFVALQEVLNPGAVESLAEFLPPNYAYGVSESVGFDKRERYAFVYNRSHVVVNAASITEVACDNRLVREPQIVDIYVREFELHIRCINVHVFWNMDQAVRRRGMHDVLTVYNKAKRNEPHTYTIVMGDFNISPEDELVAHALSEHSLIPYITNPTRTTITEHALADNILVPRVFSDHYTINAGIYRFDELLFDNDDIQAEKSVSDHRPVWIEIRERKGLV